MWTSTLLPKFLIWPSEGPSILYTLFWLMSREDNEWQEKAAFLGPSSVTARIIGCRGGCPRSFWPPQRLAALQGKVASVDRRACSGIQVATSSDPRASLVGGCSSKHFRSPFGPERRRLPALGLSVNTPCAARRREGFATTPSLAPVARNLGHWRRSTPRCTRCRYLHPALFIRNHSRAHARSRVISVRLAFAS